MHFDLTDNVEELNLIDPDHNYLLDLSFNQPSNYYTIDDLPNQGDETVSGIFFNNIQCFRTNFESFEINFLPQLCKNFYVMGFVETKLDKEDETRYLIPNFNMYANSYTSSSGGVCIYIRENLVCNVIHNLNYTEQYIESICIECTVDSELFVFRVIYRRPGTNIHLFNQTFTGIPNELKIKKRKCYIMGDFNLNLFDFDRNNEVQNFVDSIYSYGFYNLINRPTRVTSHSATLIDNILTNSTNTSGTSGIIMSDLSDHFAPFNFIRTSMEDESEETTIVYRDFDHSDPDTVRATVLNLTTNVPFDEDDVNEVYNKLSGILETASEQCYPLKSKQIRNSRFKPWLSRDLLERIKTRHKMYKKYVKRPITFGEEYRAYRNNLNRLIKDAKHRYFYDKLESAIGSSKNTWKVLNTILKRSPIKKNSINSLTIGNSTFDKPEDICNQLNIYFSEIGIRVTENIPLNNASDPMRYLHGQYPDFECQPTNTAEVKSIIKKIKDTGPGVDNIHIKMIKICEDILSPILVNIFNKSLANGVFPTNMKTAKIIPIFKSSNRSNPDNYRSVSILCSLSKILESIMYSRLIDHLTSHHILIPQQFGFRKNHSPQMALVSLVNKIIEKIDSKEYVIGLFLDLSKAFDSMNHEILLNKLEHYGIRGSSLLWFKSYLHNRTQYLIVNNCKSDLIDLSTGVPQGSILGPLLFLISVNDIVNCSSLLSYVLFADDCNALNSDQNLIDLILSTNLELVKLGEWFIANRYLVNMKKTHFLLFKGKKIVNINIRLFLYGKQLKEECKTKFLGVIIDNKLNWIPHISLVRVKISKLIGIIYNVRSCLNNQSLKLLYNSLILPYLSYGILAWGNAYDVHLKKLITTQKRALRMITGSPFLAPTDILFKSNKILKVNDVYKLEVVKFVWQEIRSESAIIQFSFVADHHQYNVRNRLNLRPPEATLNLKKMWLSNIGCLIWNSLPEHLRNSRSKISLKINCKKYLIHLY